MNKLILGTTALVGASLLMAGGAYAAKPKVKWGGAIEFTAGGSDQDVEKKAFGGAASSASIGPSAGYAFRTNSELKFNASGKTDAGMKWKAEVQIEADTNVSANESAGNKADRGHTPGDETVIDETWIRFSGSWGKLTVGNQDGVEVDYLIGGDNAVGAAGDGGVDGNWQDFIDSRPANGRLWDELDDNADTSDATKIIYYTPRVGGFGAGVSFTPDTGAHGQATSTDEDPKLDEDGNPATGDFLNTWAIGADFKKKLGGAKVHIAAAVHFGENENEDIEDLMAWSVGAVVGFGGWKVAANYMDKGDSGIAKDQTVPSSIDKIRRQQGDATAWTAGIGYSQGPVHLGVSYLHSEVELPSFSDDDESDVIVVGATYMLGGGAKVFADVFWLDQDSGGSGSKDGTENEGVGFLVGVGVKW